MRLGTTRRQTFRPIAVVGEQDDAQAAPQVSDLRKASRVSTRVPRVSPDYAVDEAGMVVEDAGSRDVAISGVKAVLR